MTVRATSCAPCAPASWQQAATADAPKGGGRRALLHTASRTRAQLLARYCHVLLLLFVVLLVSVIAPSSSFADPITESAEYSLEHDIQEYDNLVGDGGAEEWTESGSELYAAIRGAAFADTLEQEFDGGLSPVQEAVRESWAANKPEQEFGDIQDHDVEQYLDDLSEGGSAEEAIEGQITGLDVAFGFVAAPALIPLTGTLVYEDITSGDNGITRGLQSAVGDYDAVVSQGGVGAEAMRWQYFPECDVRSGEGEISCVFHRKPPDALPTEESLKAEGFVSSDRGEYSEVAKNEPHSGEFYLLEAKVEGHWYASVEGCLQGSGSSFAGELDPWPEWDVEAASGNYCNNSLAIEGWPENLKHVATYLYAGEPFVYGPGSYYYRENHSRDITRYSVVGERSLSRMHMGKLKSVTKAEIEKLEGEGRIVGSQSFKPIETKAELLEALPRVIKQMSQGADNTIQRGVEHVTQGGTAESPSEEPSRYHEAEPSKPSGESPTEPAFGEIPDCTLTETTGSACVSEMESAGFTDVELDPLTWETAVVTKPADTVISTDPSAGARVETSTKVTVESNPATEDMPVYLPKPATETETGTEYQKELEEKGWTKVSLHELTEPDTQVGPGQVASTSPSWETRLNPAASPETESVTVNVDPAGSPSPGLGGASISSPGCGLTPPTTSISLAPVTSQKFGSVFPFALLPWMAESVNGIAASPTEPHFVLHVFGSEVESGNGFQPLEAVITLLRDTIAAFMWLGVAWFLWNRTIGTRTS